MINLIKQLIEFNRSKTMKEKCDCTHKYAKCAKKITVSPDGVISVSNYARCGRFMEKLGVEFKSVSDSIIIAKGS